MKAPTEYPATLSLTRLCACLGALLIGCVTARAVTVPDGVQRVEGRLEEAPFPRLSRALLQEDPQHPLPQGIRGTLEAYASFVELLPLELVSAVRCFDDVVEIQFDAGHRKHLYVELPGREEWVLDRGDQSLREGRPKLKRIEGRKLRIREVLQFCVRDGEIRSVRRGDLQVVVGLFKVDLELSTHFRPDRMACDDEGLVLLEQDERGRPFSIAGAWVPQRFDRWVRVSARSEELWIGVERPKHGLEQLYLSHASGS